MRRLDQRHTSAVMIFEEKPRATAVLIAAHVHQPLERFRVSEPMRRDNCRCNAIVSARPFPDRLRQGRSGR
jgi:hypothetical protein